MRFPRTGTSRRATLGQEAPPERIIYLQHGFLARGVFYDYTASYLAKETNSIVVAPTLTSNIFATDGMWLGGDQMHRAVADLFLDNNHALLESAKLAGYPADRTRSCRSKSSSSGIRSAAAWSSTPPATWQREPETEPQTGRRGDARRRLVHRSGAYPGADHPDIPVYNLSATPYLWNLFGTMDHALAQVRGDDFTGAQLLGGLHSDAMVGGNPLIQFGAYLLTGFSLPSNVEGSQVLAAGWINDMFEGTQTCTRVQLLLRRSRRVDHHPDALRHGPRFGSAGAGHPRLRRP